MPAFAKPADAVALGAVDAAQRIDITLVLRSRSASDEVLPVTEGCRVPLSREGATILADGSVPAIEALKRFAHDHHLEVIRSNATERLVTISGSVSSIEEAFSIKLGAYLWHGDTRIAPDRLPSLPPFIACEVESVVGLATLPLADRAAAGL